MTSMTISELKAEAQGLVARFSLALTKKKNDNIPDSWAALEKLYQHAESIFPSAGFSLKSRASTWPDMPRLANVIVVACDHADPPAPTDVPGDYGV